MSILLASSFLSFECFSVCREKGTSRKQIPIYEEPKDRSKYKSNKRYPGDRSYLQSSHCKACIMFLSLRHFLLSSLLLILPYHMKNVIKLFRGWKTTMIFFSQSHYFEAADVAGLLSTHGLTPFVPVFLLYYIFWDLGKTALIMASKCRAVQAHSPKSHNLLVWMKDEFWLN